MRGPRANDVPHAHLAALALEHGLRLATTDSGFARSPDLRWVARSADQAVVLRALGADLVAATRTFGTGGVTLRR